MFWKRSKPVEKPERPGIQALGLRVEPYAAPILRKVMGLGSDVALEPIYNLPSAGGAELYLFDYDSAQAGPKGVKPGWTSVCVILSRLPVAPLALKATRKQAPLLEAIGASASGGRLVALPDAEDFSAHISLYARAGEEAAMILTPPLRTVLLRALRRPADDIVFLLGEKQILFAAKSLSPSGVGDEVLIDLLADLLSFYAFLQRQQVAS
jgi:hypothetical protein